MDITDLITTVGFPITCVIGLSYFVYKAFHIIMDGAKEREDRLYNTIAQNQEMLARLTEINATFASTLEEHEMFLNRLNDDVNEILTIVKSGGGKNDDGK